MLEIYVQIGAEWLRHSNGTVSRKSFFALKTSLMDPFSYMKLQYCFMYANTAALAMLNITVDSAPCLSLFEYNQNI